MRTTIALENERETSARVGRITAGRFISLSLGDDVTILLPGVDAECVAYARAIAKACEDAAAEVAMPEEVTEAVEVSQ